jgi:DNA (cytosine-5)-methyltransferase 1
MRAVSLFSGVGGFEQGLQWAGIETVLQVENDPWCLSVLARHWPEVQRIDDVRKVGRADGADREGQRRGVADEGRPRADDAQHRRQPTRSGLCGDIDLVYGGFPCQDVSVAGQRRGLSGDRSGLWHEFHRVLRELRPRWCLIENVPGLLSSGGEPVASTLSMNNGHVRADQAWT